MNIQIQTTTRCNARCVLCPYTGSWFQHNPQNMTDLVFSEIIQKLKKIKKIERICPYLMNDPFMDKRIVNRLSIIQKELVFGYLEISTNAEALTDKIIGELADILPRTPYRFIVSVQGASFSQHQKLMSVNTDRVWDNIQKLDEVLDITIQGCGVPECKQETNNNYYNQVQFVNYIKKNLYTGSSAGIRFFPYNDRGGQIKDSLQYNRNKDNCSRLWNWLHLCYDGQITLCCNDYNRQYLFGNILDYDSPEDFHKSPKFRSFCVDYYNKTEGLLCNKCSMV